MVKLKTLLVDDNASFLALAKELLADSCPSIELVGTASDGLEAVAKAEAMKPDLIIMDLQMPRMGGLQATRLIKAQDAPPVILLVSNYDDTDHRQFAAQVGADGFVNKQDFEGRVAEFVATLQGGAANA